MMLRTEAPPLHPDVATGLLDPCQEGLHPWPQVRHVDPMLPEGRRTPLPAKNQAKRRIETLSTRPMQANVAMSDEPP